MKKFFTICFFIVVALMVKLIILPFVIINFIVEWVKDCIPKEHSIYEMMLKDLKEEKSRGKNK